MRWRNLLRERFRSGLSKSNLCFRRPTATFTLSGAAACFAVLCFLAGGSVDASSGIEFRSALKACLEVNVKDGLWVRRFLFLSGLESGGNVSRARAKADELKL
jgi:hypothetical protein